VCRSCTRTPFVVRTILNGTDSISEAGFRPCADARVHTEDSHPPIGAEVGWNDHVQVDHQGEDFRRGVVLSLSEKTGKRWLASGWRKMCDRFDDFLSSALTTRFLCFVRFQARRALGAVSQFNSLQSLKQHAVNSPPQPLRPQAAMQALIFLNPRFSYSFPPVARDGFAQMTPFLHLGGGGGSRRRL
jgi:hypothetical protein